MFSNENNNNGTEIYNEQNKYLHLYIIIKKNESLKMKNKPLFVNICNRYGLQFTDSPTGSYNKLQKEILNINMNQLSYNKNNIKLQSYEK